MIRAWNYDLKPQVFGQALINGMNICKDRTALGLGLAAVVA
jgi:hypothetical protein